MNQTAVEWLVEQLKDMEYDLRLIPNTINQAKEMEKEQIENAYKRGKKHKKPLKDSNPITKYLK